MEVKKKEEKSLPMSDKRVIDDICDITFGQYADVVLGNTKVLAIADDVTDKELENARQLIMVEFADASGDYSYMAASQTQLRYAKLNLKYLGLLLSMTMLDLNYEESTFEYLKDVGIIKRKEDYPTTVEELRKITNRINSELTRLKVNIDELDARMKNVNKGVDNKKATRKDFVKLLASVSQYLKFNVDFDTNCAVVAEYVNRLKQYQASMEARKHNKRR